LAFTAGQFPTCPKARIYEAKPSRIKSNFYFQEGLSFHDRFLQPECYSDKEARRMQVSSQNIQMDIGAHG
jgi:hypothetical protein